MPYASLKQLRFMHARHPGKAGKIDADIRASGERAINAKHNISTMSKSDSLAELGEISKGKYSLVAQAGGGNRLLWQPGKFATKRGYRPIESSTFHGTLGHQVDAQKRALKEAAYQSRKVRVGKAYHYGPTTTGGPVGGVYSVGTTSTKPKPVVPKYKPNAPAAVKPTSIKGLPGAAGTDYRPKTSGKIPLGFKRGLKAAVKR